MASLKVFTMRSVLFLLVCLSYVVVGQDINAMRDMPKYDSRYDYLDIDAILDSKRLVKNYVECLIHSHKCTAEGKALKRILPEALRTKCVRCTEKQKRTAVKVIKRLKYEYPEEWGKLSSRWDPTGDFTRYFEEYLAKENFNTIYGNGPEVISSTLPPPPPTTPTPEPEPASSPPPIDVSTSPKPVILNRFGDDGEIMMVSPSGNGVTDLPISTTVRPVMTRPPQIIQERVYYIIERPVYMFPGYPGPGFYPGMYPGIYPGMYPGFYPGPYPGSYPGNGYFGPFQSPWFPNCAHHPNDLDGRGLRLNADPLPAPSAANAASLYDSHHLHRPAQLQDNEDN